MKIDLKKIFLAIVDAVEEAELHYSGRNLGKLKHERVSKAIAIVIVKFGPRWWNWLPLKWRLFIIDTVIEFTVFIYNRLLGERWKLKGVKNA
ncbi:MAG: hypothetical protein FJY65_03590 [Calditrichaeota bacterium]|nr:hypothetical protein [Calditrichota bacterium]